MISKVKNIENTDFLVNDPSYILANLELEEYDIGVLFKKIPSGTIINGYKDKNLFVPKINENYCFNETLEEVCTWFCRQSDPLYMFGPTGSGKTSIIKQIAARINYPVFDVTGHSRLEFVDMVGHLTVKNNNMSYQYGPLALAAKFGGLFLLNEIDLLDPATLSGLNGILDGEPLCVVENQGELIELHPNFRFAATANSNGAADQTGLYQGVLRQNLAFMDRFWLCELNYPTPEEESQILARAAPNLPSSISQAMIEVANETRRLFMASNINNDSENALEVTFSTRTLLRWADLTQRFLNVRRKNASPILFAFDRALGFRASPETRTFLHNLVKKTFSGNII
jgi:cobaltochelatase CobS